MILKKPVIFRSTLLNVKDFKRCFRKFEGLQWIFKKYKEFLWNFEDFERF